MGQFPGQLWDKQENNKTINSLLPERDSGQIDGRSDPKQAEPLADDSQAKAETSKRKRAEYPEAFQELWKAYPTSPNMSKLEAFKAWDRLDSDDRDLVMRSVAPFKRWIAGQREGYIVVYLERYIRKRQFEGHAAQASAAPAAPKAVLDDTWRDRLSAWRSRGGHWPWRPVEPPDDPRTTVPRHVLAEFGIAHNGPLMERMLTGADTS